MNLAGNLIKAAMRIENLKDLSNHNLTQQNGNDRITGVELRTVSDAVIDEVGARGVVDLADEAELAAYPTDDTTKVVMGGKLYLLTSEAGEGVQSTYDNTKWWKPVGNAVRLKEDMFSDSGNVVATQEADKVRLDLNVITDAPDGLQTYNNAQQNMLFLQQLVAGSMDYSQIPALIDWWAADKGLTLVDGKVTNWAGLKGGVWAAPTALARPTYLDTGGPNSKACIDFLLQNYMKLNKLNVPAGTMDMHIVMVVKYSLATGQPASVLLEHSDSGYNKGSFFIAVNDVWVPDKLQSVHNDPRPNSFGNESPLKVAPRINDVWHKISAGYYKSRITDESYLETEGVVSNDYAEGGTLNCVVPFPVNLPAFLGARNGSQLFSKMQVTDVIILSRQLDLITKTAINLYIKQRYGL